MPGLFRGWRDLLHLTTRGCERALDVHQTNHNPGEGQGVVSGSGGGQYGTEKYFTLYFPGMNKYFYKKFLLLAFRKKKKGLFGERSLGLSWESSVAGLKGGTKNSRLRTHHEGRHRGRQALKRFREPGWEKVCLECWIWAGA